MRKNTYIDVPTTKVQKVKKYVYSLPKNEQKKYYSLLNSLSNRFYGNAKSLTEQQVKQYNFIIKKL